MVVVQLGSIARDVPAVPELILTATTVKFLASLAQPWNRARGSGKGAASILSVSKSVRWFNNACRKALSTLSRCRRASLGLPPCAACPSTEALLLTFSQSSGHAGSVTHFSYHSSLTTDCAKPTTDEPSFSGTNAADCERFITAIRKRALTRDKHNDNAWIAAYAASCLEGPALRWFEEQEDNVQEDWKLLRRALLQRYDSQNNNEDISR